MVLHDIEEALGGFVGDGDIDLLNDERLQVIYQRESAKGRRFNKSSINDVVEATYLDELFGFALDIASDSSMIDSIKYLLSLFHHLDIYEVRNAISHPNRPFWDCYWYRVATLASDPVIERLGLKGVKQSLNSAEEGVINDPPEEWINKIIWQIPNNLPEHFDHGLTGLIGRKSETNELKRLITNQRINTVALVAPGGAGKTALALDLLHDLILSPSISKSFKGIVYVTMKLEKLTAEGLKTIDSAETISEVKNQIVFTINDIFEEQFKCFDDAVVSYEDQELLLCLDNLETLLINDADAFEDFNINLPPKWKVLLTSRISVSNATILSINTLKDKSASALARAYHNKRGGVSLTSDDYSNIASKCFFNPLAIRLSIDLLMTGRDIPSSVNVANKEIAEFSYKNLIDVLNENSIMVLEAIFVEGSSSRMSLCELLKKTIEEITEAIGELTRTSLISRNSSDDGEFYRLSDSVRELLLVSPSNIRIRSQVQKTITNLRTLAHEIDARQSQNELPKWHTDYIPEDTKESLKILITDVIKCLKKQKGSNQEAIIGLYRRIKDTESLHEECELICNAKARILERLKDFKNAEDCYRKAMAIAPESPRPRYLLARLYHDIGQYPDAVDQYRSLIKDGWANADKDILQFGNSIYIGYFLSLLYSSRHEEVLNETKKWKEQGEYRAVIGTFRAAAWKRKMEKTVDSDPVNTIKCLNSAAKIFQDIFKNNGYSKITIVHAIKLIDEITYTVSRTNYTISFKDDCLLLLDFVHDHIYEISQLVSFYRNFSDTVKKLSEISIKGNKFAESYQGDNFISTDESVSQRDNCITVNILNRPHQSVSYLFARSSQGKDYYLHFNQFRNGSWKEWSQLALGQALEVMPSSEFTDGKAHPVLEIYLI